MTGKRNNPMMTCSRPGVVLLLTLVLLVVLATLGYTFSGRVAGQRHRNQYIIDYSRARYGCDSAVKYAVATLEELSPELVDRPNEPDFSDLFALDEAAYQELLAQWAKELAIQKLKSGVSPTSASPKDTNDVNDANATGGKDTLADLEDPNSLVIRGPYGPPWPLVSKPANFEIGPTKVQMEIEDENAKYPLGLALLDDKSLERETEAGFVTFCEMMRLDASQIDSLKEQLRQVGEIRPFSVDFKPITKAVTEPPPVPAAPAAAGKAAPKAGQPATAKPPQPTAQRKVVPVAEQIAKQTTDLAKLLHSSLLDTETLAKPIFASEDRKESALKYMGLWGSPQVNINTAPRHVLEAAFIFGGNEVEIAEAVIQRRRQKPFGNLQELKTELSRYVDSIGKCEKYIVTASSCFTIRITAVSGAAKASSIIAITKQGNQVRKIAVING